MIKEIMMYTVICDGCGLDGLDGSDYAGVTEVEAAKEIVRDGSFREIDGKDYCDQCWTTDEETDEVVVRPAKEVKDGNQASGPAA